MPEMKTNKAVSLLLVGTSVPESEWHPGEYGSNLHVRSGLGCLGLLVVPMCEGEGPQGYKRVGLFEITTRKHTILRQIFGAVPDEGGGFVLSLENLKRLMPLENLDYLS